MRSRCATAVSAVFALCTLLTAETAVAQESPKQPPSPAFLEGTEAFRRILFDAGKDLNKNGNGKNGDGFQPLKTFSDLNDDPKHTLLIVFGDASRLREVPEGLRSFVNRGGALLATDRGLTPKVGQAVEAMTGFQVSGDSIICHDPDSRYRGLEFCPFLKPPDGAADAVLFRDLREQGGLSTVATNVPSYLEPVDPFNGDRLPLLAWLPGLCGPEGTNQTAEGRYLFGAGGDVGGNGGRVLLLADHSLFINEMLMQQDNGNVEFVYNCLKWMVDDGKRPRSKILFVEDGKINSKFDVPLKEVPDELLNRILDFVANRLETAARRKTEDLEERVRSFDEREWFIDNNVSPYKVLQVLVIVLAVLVVLYGCWKVGWKARYRSDLQGPLLASVLHRLVPSETVAEQRRLAQVRGNNLWEPAHDLARQCLAAVSARPGAAPPPVAVRGGWMRRWTTASRIKRLWRLAYGPPVRVPLNEWRRLLREVQTLKGAFADGTVQWQ